jgi:hypothetical protein
LPVTGGGLADAPGAAADGGAMIGRSWPTLPAGGGAAGPGPGSIIGVVAPARIGVRAGPGPG